ncbi:GNAT family N-acetyltransferase [Sinorhizobium meliloti]|uniref:GNAT family N-acetyltransferase n=1 Tax=Rhizobium meliloti TaxID=382 RepID=A0A2J0YT99_RHIML|nr:hypothetical protein [Sinorhizobium meliloti]PJR09086.1 hypothetical protein CEJ86_31940 [Sinorhizobium meliloti]
MTEASEKRFVGRSVELVALDPDRHTEAIHSGSHGVEKDALWRYLRDGPFPNVQTHRHHLARLCASDQFSGYAIVDRASSVVLGQAALMKFSVEHRSVEIGYVPFFRHYNGREEERKPCFS